MGNVLLASKVVAAFNLKDGKGEKIGFQLTPVVSSECRSNIDNIIAEKSTVQTFHFAVKHPKKDVLIKDWERVEKLLANSDFDPQETDANGQVFINPDNLQMMCNVSPDGSYKYIWKPIAETKSGKGKK